MIAFRTPTVYIAARSEDQGLAADLAEALRARDIQTTARWLDLADLTRIDAQQAEMCLADIDAADVFVLLIHRDQFRDSTGGHHVEFGYALRAGKPIVIFGERRNVFHGLSSVQVLERPLVIDQLADAIRMRAAVVNARGRAIALEPGRGV